MDRSRGRAQSVPHRLGGFALKTDTSWRKGDSSLARDPRKHSFDDGDWRSKVYPKWWNDEPQEMPRPRADHDDMDYRIDLNRSSGRMRSQSKDRRRSPLRRSHSPHSGDRRRSPLRNSPRNSTYHSYRESGSMHPHYVHPAYQSHSPNHRSPHNPKPAINYDSPRHYK